MVKLEPDVARNNLKLMADDFEHWYYDLSDNTSTALWPINEIIYQCASIVKECIQKMEGGHFALDFIQEKTKAIESLALRVNIIGRSDKT